MATKNRGLAWSVAETQLLIGLWSENKILNVTDGTTNNAKVYEKFAKKLEKRGFHRTTAQIRDRMKRLKRDYKEVVDSNKTGSGKKTCHFFHELDRILGNNAFTNAVIDHDSVPMNVCQAELGKCVSSDEEEEVNNFYTHLRDRKRLKRGLRMLDVDAVSVVNGEESAERSKLEVEKMLLEMEKLRQEIELIREEREKLALEKEILMVQRQRLLREENLVRFKENQTEFKEREQVAPISPSISVSEVGKSNVVCESERRTQSNSSKSSVLKIKSELVANLNDSNKSGDLILSMQSCVGSATSEEAANDDNGEDCIQKLAGNDVRLQKPADNITSSIKSEVKKLFLNELNIIERMVKEESPLLDKNGDSK